MKQQREGRGWLDRQLGSTENGCGSCWTRQQAATRATFRGAGPGSSLFWSKQPASSSSSQQGQHQPATAAAANGSSSEQQQPASSSSSRSRASLGHQLHALGGGIVDGGAPAILRPTVVLVTLVLFVQGTGGSAVQGETDVKGRGAYPPCATLACGTTHAACCA